METNELRNLETKFLEFNANHYQMIGKNFQSAFKEICHTYEGYRNTSINELENRSQLFYESLLNYFSGNDIEIDNLEFLKRKIKKIYSELNFVPFSINEKIYNIDLEIISITIGASKKAKINIPENNESLDFRTIHIIVGYRMNAKIVKKDDVELVGTIKEQSTLKKISILNFNIITDYETMVDFTDAFFDDLVVRTFENDESLDEEKNIMFILNKNIIKGITYLNGKKKKIIEGRNLIEGLKSVDCFNGNKEKSIDFENYLRLIPNEKNSLFWDNYKYCFTTFKSLIDLTLKYFYIVEMYFYLNERNIDKESQRAINDLKSIALEFVSCAENLKLIRYGTIEDILNLYNNLTFEKQNEFILDLYFRFLGQMLEKNCNFNLVNELLDLDHSLSVLSKDKCNISFTSRELRHKKWLESLNEIVIVGDDTIEESTKEYVDE